MRRNRLLDKGVLTAMAQALRSRTDRSISDQFGISYNTWRKIEGQQSIRVSIADRLERQWAWARSGRGGSLRPCDPGPSV